MKSNLHIGRILGVVALIIAGCGPSGGGAPDGAVIDGAPAVIDAGPPPDAISEVFGDPCTTQVDCAEGVCVDGPDGNVCTAACVDDCPLGWSCRITEVDGALLSLCLPIVVSVCVPCTDDDQCLGGACIELEDGAGYCLASCFESSCPEGYTCGDDPTGEHPGGFCIPDTGSCSCTADNDGALRTCELSNGIGTCYGTETCVPDLGWTVCTAPTASAEVCDGLDNDCDFLIDDGVAGGEACSNEVLGVGSCPGVSLCAGAAGILCQGPLPSPEICNYTDDDCDTTVDEGYPDLGDLCSDGIGGCERFGVIRCDSGGTSQECSAVAGTPVAEACNGIDDNCNGPIDEAFPTLGDDCSAGVGICERQGDRVCSGDGLSTVCGATAGPAAPSETCNGLDDDCDGPFDEGFYNAGTQQYDQHTACGSCAVDCTVIYGLPNASGTCSLAGSPTCVMSCAGGAFNLNGVVADGCEFILDPDAIYVSTVDGAAVDDANCGLGPVGTGAGHRPCKTIGRGLLRATASGRSKVLVANGLYDEAVTMVNGKHLLGGYQSDTWERDVGSTGTQIAGAASVGNHDHTVRALSITAPTVFEGFVVIGSVNGKVSGNSYAIYVADSNANLSIRNNRVFGGRGGPGAAGTTGPDGTLGSNGTGRSSNPAIYDAISAVGASACDGSNNRAHGNGGALSCGGDDTSGGNGGGNQCPPASSCSGCSGANCTSCTFFEATGIDGLAGQPGAGGAPGGGSSDAGDDMVLWNNGNTCYVPATLTYGSDGLDGSNAAHGGVVTGCSGAAGTVSGGHWAGSTAPSGAFGGNGGGGGGGAGGGGSRCQQCPGGKDKLGGHGGGGGAGGCGGSGGVGASAGGAAFAIFVVGVAAPVVTGNTVVRGEGGVGGVGGAGGVGGPGGVGADGGISGVFCAEPAGRGGNGGDGGHGSGGGGGCGGSSFGVYTYGVGSPNYCQPAAGNTIGGGAAGAGGAGGYSLINAGGNGAVGALGACSFN